MSLDLGFCRHLDTHLDKISLTVVDTIRIGAARAAQPRPCGEAPRCPGSVAPLIARSHGCKSCRVLRGRENPGKLIVLAVWTTVEAHQASAKAIPPESLTAMMPLLAGPPKDAYFTDDPF